METAFYWTADSLTTSIQLSFKEITHLFSARGAEWPLSPLTFTLRAKRPLVFN